MTFERGKGTKEALELGTYSKIIKYLEENRNSDPKNYNFRIDPNSLSIHITFYEMFRSMKALSPLPDYIIENLDPMTKYSVGYYLSQWPQWHSEINKNQGRELVIESIIKEGYVPTASQLKKSFGILLNYIGTKELIKIFKKRYGSFFPPDFLIILEEYRSPSSISKNIKLLQKIRKSGEFENPEFKEKFLWELSEKEFTEKWKEARNILKEYIRINSVIREITTERQEKNRTLSYEADYDGEKIKWTITRSGKITEFIYNGSSKIYDSENTNYPLLAKKIIDYWEYEGILSKGSFTKI